MVVKAQSKRSKVKRVPNRGHYDSKTINEILDQAFVAQVGFVVDQQPFVIPMAYGREGNKLYLHGATTSRLMTETAKGIPICVTVTHIDGIVLARSVFHHSVNYRSAVIFGRAKAVDDTHKMHALEVVSDHILKDRWKAAREPNAKELKATAVLELTIEEASAKNRTGPPKDDKEDYELPVWAGVIPMVTTFEAPEADPELPSSIKPGKEITQLYGGI